MISKSLAVALSLWVAFASVRGASTINSTNAYSYGANIGWMNWHPDGTNGVSIGAYILSGYVYGANVGWISLGNGSPANHIRYANNSATDFGVNFTIDPNNRAHGLLRGYAYGANIGWINFENTGNPYVILSNGQLGGYAYSANVGWINLGDGTFFLQTDRVDPGVDTDGDGLPDAWEYTYLGNASSGANDDSDGDGETNLSEYRSGTNPSDPNSVEHSARQLNISTRLRVESGDNVLIGGFIITGADPKPVIVRAIGPSLTASGVPGALQNPTLELFDSSGTSLLFNDDWKDSQGSAILATTVAPGDDRESAIVSTLAPGSYTAVVRGVGGTTGVGLVEAYDLDSSNPTKFANNSTRGFVDAGDNVMIGGFIAGAGAGNGGSGSEKVVVRAIGPSLTALGVPGALEDPILELHDSSGTTIATNDNWQDSQGAEIQATRLAPSDPNESAILRILPSGTYTVVLKGANNGRGVAVMEIYTLN